jgi:hypothetical protein
MSYESNDKMVSHPSHYKFGNFEVIDVVDAVTEELSGYECNYTAQALQYLMRWHRKNGDQDLEKAIWFIQRILDKHKAEKDIDLKNDETLYSLHQEEENCEHCKNFDPGPNGIIGRCPHSIYSDGRVHKDCGCSHFEKRIQEEKKVEWVCKELSERKLEPGCDKCEISECGFLKDPFMNPPYDELQKQCTEYKKALEWANEKNNKFIEINNRQKEEIKQLKIEKHEIRADLKCLISDDLNNLEEIDKHADNADLVRKWCRRAGVDVQKINDRYFTEKEVSTEE